MKGDNSGTAIGCNPRLILSFVAFHQLQPSPWGPGARDRVRILGSSSHHVQRKCSRYERCLKVGLVVLAALVLRLADGLRIATRMESGNRLLVRFVSMPPSVGLFWMPKKDMRPAVRDIEKGKKGTTHSQLSGVFGMRCLFCSCYSCLCCLRDLCPRPTTDTSRRPSAACTVESHVTAKTG